MIEPPIQEALAYFRDKQPWPALLSKLRDKYISLGHVGGSVTLTGLSLAEKELLGGFMQKNYRGSKSVTISAAAFQRALDDSRFQGVTVEALLAAYFAQPLVAKAVQKQQREAEQASFFQALMDEYRQEAGDTPAVQWLAALLLDCQEGSRLLKQQYQESPQRLKQLLWSVLRRCV